MFSRASSNYRAGAGRRGVMAKGGRRDVRESKSG